MSRYTNGWTWSNEASTDQTDSVVNKGACERFYQEIQSIYEGIPDTSDERHQENLDAMYESIAEDYGEEAANKKLAERAAETQGRWGQIEALEAMLGQRGGRLKEDFEDFNEFAPMMRLLDQQATDRSNREG